MFAWLVLAGCGAAPVVEPAPVAATPVVEPVVSEPVVAVVKQPTRMGAERPAKRSASAEERAAHTAYKAEMQTGRTQTKAKAYAEAIAAFDRALAKRPQQPRALAERGYAKLLANDLPGARVDLEAARERSDDPQRLGPIWFNLGLVEEAAGDAEAARRAFTRSNELRPGKAVQAKLAGATACTAEIDRAPVAGKHLASWKALFDLWMNGEADEENPLKTTKEIQDWLCFDHKRPEDPLWDLCFYPASFTNSHSSELVGPAEGRGLVYYGELGSSESGACQNSGKLAVTKVGPLLHARWVEFGRDWDAIPMKDRKADCDEEIDECELECRDFSVTVDDYVIDPAGAQRILRVRRTTNTVPRPTDDMRQSVEPEVVEAAMAVRVEVAENGVTLRGGGCDETVAVVRPVK
jgi:tetratricopeptide (TPR) repeat protein